MKFVRRRLCRIVSAARGVVTIGKGDVQKISKGKEFVAVLVCTIQTPQNQEKCYLYQGLGGGPATSPDQLKKYIAPGATHGKRASRKLCDTLLGYIKRQKIVEFMLLHS